MNALGIWLKSPLAVSMMISRHIFDAVVVTPDTAPKGLVEFGKATTGAKRLKVAIVAPAAALKNRKLRLALAKLDRIIVIDSPDMLSALNVRMINIQYSARGRWTPIQVDMTSLAAHLQADQDLSYLASAEFKMPKVGPDVTRLTTHHLFRALPRMAATSPEAAPSDVATYIQIVCRYAAGIGSAGDMREATKVVVAAGGNPTITPRLTKHLKTNKDLLRRAFSLYAKFRIRPQILSEHLGDDKLLAKELSFLAANLSAADIAEIAKTKKTLPEPLKKYIGSDTVEPAPEDSSSESRLLDCIEAALGYRPDNLSEKAVSKLRRHFKQG